MTQEQNAGLSNSDPMRYVYGRIAARVSRQVSGCAIKAEDVYRVLQGATLGEKLDGLVRAEAEEYGS